MLNTKEKINTNIFVGQGATYSIGSDSYAMTVIKYENDVVTVQHDKEIPTKNIGVHCNEPYDCDFKAHCWKHIPEYSIFDISRLKQKKKFKC